MLAVSTTTLETMGGVERDAEETLLSSPRACFLDTNVQKETPSTLSSPHHSSISSVGVSFVIIIIVMLTHYFSCFSYEWLAGRPFQDDGRIS
jgi:hypothetical protein